MHKYKKLIRSLGENRVKTNEVLKNYSSLKIGGPADLFFKALTIQDLILAVKSAHKYDVDYFILGGGTNILFSDDGFRGLIIKNESGNIRLKGLTGRRFAENTKKSLVNKVYLEVDSGVTINRLVRNTLSQGFSGLQYFLGQPGTVGGAVWINAHNVNQGQFFGDLVKAATLLNPQKGVISVNREYFHFAYDKSVIQKSQDTVLTVTLELATGDKEELWKIAKDSLLYRQKTQPSGIKTAGCLFRNIDKSDALRLATPNYTCSAGYLLDACGMKGITLGGARISDTHANFLINLGQARTSDVLELINLAKEKVRNRFGVNLQLEVVVLDKSLKKKAYGKING